MYLSKHCLLLRAVQQLSICRPKILKRAVHNVSLYKFTEFQINTFYVCVLQIEKEVNRIKEFFDIFTTDIKDKQRYASVFAACTDFLCRCYSVHIYNNKSQKVLIKTWRDKIFQKFLLSKRDNHFYVFIEKQYVRCLVFYSFSVGLKDYRN